MEFYLGRLNLHYITQHNKKAQLNDTTISTKTENTNRRLTNSHAAKSTSSGTSQAFTYLCGIANPSKMGTQWVTPSPESKTTPVVLPVEYRLRTACKQSTNLLKTFLFDFRRRGVRGGQHFLTTLGGPHDFAQRGGGGGVGFLSKI